MILLILCSFLLFLANSNLLTGEDPNMIDTKILIAADQETVLSTNS